MQRRKFSETEKLNILDSAEKEGVTSVLREHRLSYSVFVRWKRKYRPPPPGMPVRLNRKAIEMIQLSEENGRLRKIIAEQALELERKEEELKKYKKA
jgi:putative transposase